MSATGGASFPLLVQAIDLNGDPVAYAFQNGNPLPTGTTDSGADDLVLNGPWLTSMTTQTLSTVDEVDGGPVYATTLSEAVGGSLTPALTGSIPNSYATHPGFADFIQVEATSTNYASAVAIANSLPAPSVDGAIAIDVSPLTDMPVLDGVSVDASNPAQPVISWTTSQGSLSTVTGIIAFATWSSSEGTPYAGTWTIVSPGTAATSLQAPAIAPGLSYWLPAPGATFSDRDAILAVQGSALPTYAAVRAGASASQEPQECNLAAPVIPALAAPGQTLMVTATSSAPCD